MASPMDVAFDIQELVHAMITARQVYEDRRDAAKSARYLEDTAAKDLIAAEKALDEKMKELKEAAPPGSHWHTERLPRRTVAVS